MLCVTLQSYSAPCQATTGGVSDIWIYDPEDFNWTQDAVTKSYTAVAQRAGAEEGKMHHLKFERKEAEYKWKQSRNGCSVKYEFDIDVRLPNLSQAITNYLSSLDSAGCCCGLGMVIRLNSGKIFVLGERFVNASSVPFFEIVMQDSEGTSGRKFEDFNGATVKFKAEYFRAANEFTGLVSVIEAFQ